MKSEFVATHILYGHPGEAPGTEVMLWRDGEGDSWGVYTQEHWDTDGCAGVADEEKRTVTVSGIDCGWLREKVTK